MTTEGVDMLKYLTQKFRSQSLNEIQSIQNKECQAFDFNESADDCPPPLCLPRQCHPVVHASCTRYSTHKHKRPANCTSGGFECNYHEYPDGRVPGMGDEDHDSGTESDEDIHDLEDLDDTGSVCCQHCYCSCNQTSMSRTTHEISEHSLDSISCTSDYERQSLDFERHSSEEELSTIHKGITSEKRKWSHAHSASCDSTGSVDEEVKELMLEPQPILFSSSPPKDITVDCISLNQNNEQICDETIQFIVGPESQKSNFRSENPCAVVITKDKRTHKANTSQSKLTYPKGTVPMLISPRKRHRKVSVSDNKNESSSTMRRPSLDFEKMQKNAVKKQCVHSVGKAKVVKIKTVSGSNAVTSKCLSDPAIFSFRSISSVRFGQLTPVEQPPCAY